jgi:hypothetical protein
VINAQDWNRLYVALGSPERAVNGELMYPHIDRVCQLITELVERVQVPHNEPADSSPQFDEREV